MKRDTHPIKTALFETCLKEIDQRIANARQAMEAAEESRNNETKSSVGDKYETGRAMMQGEQERNKVQLLNAIGQKQALQQINYAKSSTQVQAGTLVQTNYGYYFLAIGLGKIQLKAQTYFVISPTSPIGQQLLQLKVGENTTFQNRQYLIQNIW
ncbi:MAG: 3-oxoacyl-ACP synthase [Bacteroidota bacterium]